MKPTHGDRCGRPRAAESRGCIRSRRSPWCWCICVGSPHYGPGIHRYLHGVRDSDKGSQREWGGEIKWPHWTANVICQREGRNLNTVVKAIFLCRCAPREWWMCSRSSYLWGRYCGNKHGSHVVTTTEHLESNWHSSALVKDSGVEGQTHMETNIGGCKIYTFQLS